MGRRCQDATLISISCRYGRMRLHSRHYEFVLQPDQMFTGQTSTKYTNRKILIPFIRTIVVNLKTHPGRNFDLYMGSWFGMSEFWLYLHLVLFPPASLSVCSCVRTEWSTPLTLECLFFSSYNIIDMSHFHDNHLHTIKIKQEVNI